MAGQADSRFETEAMVKGLMPWVACESPTYDAASVNRMIGIVAAEAAAAGVAVEPQHLVREVALENMIELPRVVQRRADFVASAFARTETLDVMADRIERFFQHAVIAVEQVDRLY